MSNPFLSIVTRCCQRPVKLARNIKSVAAQKCHDLEQVFLVDRERRGLLYANQQFERHVDAPRGQYIYHLDDDGFLPNSQFVTAVKALAVKANYPDVILVRVAGGRTGHKLLPPPEVWGLNWERGERPAFWIGCGYCFAVKSEVWQANVWRYHHDQGKTWKTGGDWKFMTGLIQLGVGVVRLDSNRRGGDGQRGRCAVEKCKPGWFERVVETYNMERVGEDVWRIDYSG